MYMAYESYHNPTYHLQCTMIGNTTELVTDNYSQALEFYNECESRRDPNMQDLFNNYINQTFRINSYNTSK